MVAPPLPIRRGAARERAHLVARLAAWPAVVALLVPAPASELRAQVPPLQDHPLAGASPDAQGPPTQTLIALHAALSAAPPEGLSLLLEFDTDAIDAAAASRRRRLPGGHDDANELARRERDYRQRKAEVMTGLGADAAELVEDFSHLPMQLRRVRSTAELQVLAARPGVRALHPPQRFQRALTESLPLIGQPAVAAVGLLGAGRTVAVVDDGVDLGLAAFGGCSAVATPAATCRIAAAVDFAAAPTTHHGHGNHVAATVLGVAPQARIAALNVFSANGALSSDIVRAVNHAIANRVALDLVAINLSLGDGSHHVSRCPNSVLAAPVASARAAGLSVVAAAGNTAYVNGGFTPGVAEPACVPGVLSVGAVYDGALGGLAWQAGTANACTDGLTAVDAPTCFSASGAGVLDLLAPGAMVSAGGQTLGGTSQATPHVGGALAVLRAAFPAESLAQAETRLVANGTPITDPRNGLLTPRLNLRAAARPAHDDLAQALNLPGSAGSTAGSNRLATREANEPQPDASAGQSVWWAWTAPASGQLTLDTSGSGFDTRLDVYRGSTPATLQAVAGNDDAAVGVSTSALRFQAQAGTRYLWSVDGPAGASGDVRMAWSLNTAALANLTVGLSGPYAPDSGALLPAAWPGSVLRYQLQVDNAGPQTATAVRVQLTLPAGLTAVVLPAECIASTAQLVDCRVPELVAGGRVRHALDLQVADSGTPSGLTIGAGAATDTPESSGADNAATLALTVDPNASIPALPGWAAGLGALTLLGLGRRGSTRR